MRSAVLVGFALIATLGAAYGQPAVGPSCPLPWGTPWVPDKATAKAIYLAVARTRPWFKSLLKQYPIVVVKDEGDYWGVSQHDNRPPPKPGLGEVIVTAGGGQLDMEIDKCSGAIRHAVMNR